MAPFRLSALMGCALFAAGGCSGNEFAPYGRLTSLRVLAIRSEPVAPAPGESTTLSALLYVPRGQSEPELEWSWCPFAGSSADGYPCLVEERDLQQLTGALEPPALDLGTGSTVTFQNAFPAPVLQGLCAGVLGVDVIPNCEGGFPVQIKLRVTTEEDEVMAVRKLRLRPDAETGSNTNPELQGVSVKVEDEWRPIDDSFAELLKRDETSELRASVTDDQAEEYQEIDERGNAKMVRERLNIAWFVESGDTKSERTSYVEDLFTIEQLEHNEWIPSRSEDYSGDTSELVLVLRDNREGVGWHRVTVGLTEDP